MSRILRAGWAALAIIFLFVAPAEAGRRIALVVANATYKDAPLDNPTVDAKLVEPALEAAGFEVRLVLNADLATFDNAVAAFATQSNKAEVALFYFAGHGFAVNDGLAPRNFLLSTDAVVTSSSERVMKAGGIPLDEIVQRLNGAADTTLIFVDACRNDPRASRGVGGTRGFARLETSGIPNLFVGLSTRLGDRAQDGAAGLGSPFARAFAQEIPKAGMRIEDAFAAIRRAVYSETQQVQKPEIVQDDLDVPLMLVALAKPAAPAQIEPRPVVVLPPVQAAAPVAAPAAPVEVAILAPAIPSLPGLAPSPTASGLTYSGIQAEPYAGANDHSFIGAWVTLYNVKMDGTLFRNMLSFEITGNYPGKRQELVFYSIGISDTQTVKAFDRALVMKADNGNRFFIDDHAVASKLWKKAFRSMSAADQRAMAGVCQSIAAPEAQNKVLQATIDASKSSSDKSVQAFWQVPDHRQGIIAMGRVCYDAVKATLAKPGEAFVQVN